MSTALFEVSKPILLPNALRKFFTMPSMPQDELIPTRASLLHRLKDPEDQRSWDDFYNIYSRLIFETALKAGLNHAEAQDVLQDTLVAVSKHIKSFKYDPKLGSFKTWLFMITKCRITDQFRKRGPARVNADESPGNDTPVIEQVPDPNIKLPEDAWDEQWEANLEQAAKSTVKRNVDPQHYQIYDFLEHKNWDADRVSTMFGVSKDQIYVIKSRIKKKIADEVTRLNRDVL